ncbi:hypothetical protein WDM22_16075 [Bradyrhizobium septentrionale]|uniref:hypothetical protein n=1 Tax=Bradyrhizobium septentrionale TaxID=1404411 RepID=UPI0030D0E9AF
MINGHFKHGNFARGTLIGIHVLVCCTSLFALARHGAIGVGPSTFHFFFELHQFPSAVLIVSAFALVGACFIFAPPTIGYFIGFYLYTMVLSYLWLNCFTDLTYNHLLAGASAFLSFCLFLLPALLLRTPFPHPFRLSTAAFDRLLLCLLCICILVTFAGMYYNFKLIAIEDLSTAREQIAFPKLLNYLLPVTTSSLLPFAFAGFAVRKNYFLAAFVAVLQTLLYPVTLAKLALFAPFWLIALFLLTRLAEFRVATILSLLLPMVIGLLAVELWGNHSSFLFSMVNFRMIAIPALALDVYNDFFSRHELTHFCQISVLKWTMGCAYDDQLSVIMQNTYHLGYFNASFFATEGVASVGPLLSPVIAAACGLVIAIGNRSSAHLPPSFVMVSGAMLPQVFLNVPMTVALVTHGAALLFLLWAVTPCDICENGLAGHVEPSKG